MNEKVSFGVGPVNNGGSKLAIEVIVEGIKIHSKLTQRSKSYVSDVLFVVKLALILDLVLEYLVLTLGMLLFNKISSIVNSTSFEAPSHPPGNRT